MARVKTGPATRKRRKKWLKQAKGYWGGKSRLYKSARLQVMHGLISAYRDRKQKKRVFRSLMITRINAALEPYDLSYSRFINGLKKAGVTLDRSVLSEVAIQAPEDFARLVELAKQNLAS
ncbi:MAG: 50S ribosomal protein L20 [candidate division WOR-3 bacterium]|uniref:Large ribosomal subunit protein bL20 n=1 Tax=candidate division WOR-3 bacterium TaxID=2052148 RepID=A0A7C1NE02_UNCW3|nr:50S ribosomal protein L20 [candidate division WOR-3 bacterium]